MARGKLTLLLSALTVLVQLSSATPVHNHKSIHHGIRPRHVHGPAARRSRIVLGDEEDQLARRSDNDSSRGLHDRTWLDEHSSLERSDLDQLLDELGLSYTDVRELVKRYADGQPPVCTSTVTATALPTATASNPTTSATSPASPTNTGARNMNVVYYAQTPATQQVPLTTICNDPTIDIVVLAFVTDFFSAGGYPTLNLASKCWAASDAQRAIGATGLIDCVSDGFAAQVASCQAAGKKVMLSLGGAISNMNIPSAAAAGVAAQNIWDLFLGGGTTNAAISAARPFGKDVVLDGIDFDNEAPAYSTYIPDLARALRTLMDGSTSGKRYLLSAAPQCPRPDQSIPIPQMLDVLDYVWVQFYNNPSCNVNAGQGFLDSLQAWSADLATVTTTPTTPTTTDDGFNGEVGPPQFGPTDIAPPMDPRQPGSRKKTKRSDANSNVLATRATSRPPPKLLIGVLASPQQGTGYVDPTTLQGILQQVKALPGGLPANLAGVMYWDGAYQELSGAGGAKSYAEVVREVLG